MKKALIVDIDGTIANIEHRRHHVKKKTPNWKGTTDWKAFNGAMVDDSLNEWAKVIIDKFKDTHTIILCTGRMEQYRRHTIDWLKKFDITYNHLMMRKQDDYRSDDIIKEEIYNKKIKGYFDVDFVVDDRLRVCRMWHRVGLTLLRCGDPDADF